MLKFIVVKNLIFPDFLGEYTTAIYQVKILLLLHSYKMPYWVGWINCMPMPAPSSKISEQLCTLLTLWFLKEISSLNKEGMKIILENFITLIPSHFYPRMVFHSNFSPVWPLVFGIIEFFEESLVKEGRTGLSSWQMWQAVLPPHNFFVELWKIK